MLMKILLALLNSDRDKIYLQVIAKDSRLGGLLNYYYRKGAA